MLLSELGVTFFVQGGSILFTESTFGKVSGIKYVLGLSTSFQINKLELVQ